MQGSRRVREVTFNHINPSGPKLANAFVSAVMEEVGRVSFSSVNFLQILLYFLDMPLLFPAITAILSYVCMC